MKYRTLASIIGTLLCYGCAGGPGVALSSIPNETWQVDFGTESWNVGSHEQNRVERMTEWIPVGQDVRDWKEIVTDTFVVGRFPTATFFMQSNLADLTRVVDGFQSNVIYDTGTEALYEWWHPDSGKWPAEDQLTLVKYYPAGAMVLSYARKGPHLDETLRAKWIERLKNAKLR